MDKLEHLSISFKVLIDNYCSYFNYFNSGSDYIILDKTPLLVFYNKFHQDFIYDDAGHSGGILEILYYQDKDGVFDFYINKNINISNLMLYNIIENKYTKIELGEFFITYTFYKLFTTTTLPSRHNYLNTFQDFFTYPELQKILEYIIFRFLYFSIG